MGPQLQDYYYFRKEKNQTEERLKKSRAEGTRRAEAIGINSSLMVLGKCIAALVCEKSHIPYHESQLTMLLGGEL